MLAIYDLKITEVFQGEYDIFSFLTFVTFLPLRGNKVNICRAFFHRLVLFLCIYIRIFQINKCLIFYKQHRTKFSILPWLVWPQWIERQVNQKAAGSIPGQGTHLCCGPGPPVSGVWEAMNWCFSHTSMFLSLPFPHPSFISKNKYWSTVLILNYIILHSMALPKFP